MSLILFAAVLAFFGASVALGQDPKPAPDPAADQFKALLASYAGLTIAVTVVVSSLKAMWKTWIEGKEPAVAVILTYVLGIVAKIALPAVYGTNTVGSWALHSVLLLLVAGGAKLTHDGVLNAFKKPDSTADTPK